MWLVERIEEERSNRRSVYGAGVSFVVGGGFEEERFAAVECAAIGDIGDE